MSKFGISLEILGKLFPFSFMINSKGEILSYGKSLKKLNPNLKCRALFQDLYKFKNHSNLQLDEVLKNQTCQMIVIESHSENHQLMGQIIPTEDNSQYIFFVNLFVNDLQKLSHLNLTFNDFAIQDQVFDFLMLLQTHQKAIQEASKINAQLAEAIETAKAASTMKSQFLANMSHELRTPMNGVLGMASVLIETTLDDEQKDFVDSIITSGQSMLNLINDILDLSKIEAGFVQFEQAPIQLETIISEIFDLVKVSTQKKKLNWLVNSSPVYNLWHKGDRERIKQVLLNFVGNAVKFTEKGFVRLDVEIVESINSTDTLRFTIQDTGVGMCDDTLKKIFNPFVQGDSSTTKKFGGTGLGLSICKKIVSALGGQIGVKSYPNEGTVFWFEIPLERLLAETNIIKESKKSA